MLTAKEKTTINKLLDDFDFHKAHVLFVVMGWTYHTGVPTAAELRETAHRLLTDAIDRSHVSGKTQWVESGRFKATCLPEDSELELELVFDSKSIPLKIKGKDEGIRDTSSST